MLCANVKKDGSWDGRMAAFQSQRPAGCGYFKSEYYSILAGKRLPYPAVYESWNEVRT